ncbi:MAG: DUF3991 and toprim domain-containing protein [Clostridia bacterium]|nr:DUF3991 and toprim domain-containing protein [Clostridia bacterium]
MHYSEEQIYAARRVPIAAILDNMNESYKKCGKEFYWRKHDSVWFHDNVWYQHSAGVGGQAIDFCQSFFNMNFYESLDYLTDTFLYNQDLGCVLQTKNNPAGLKYCGVSNDSSDDKHSDIDINEDNATERNLPMEPDMAVAPAKAYRYLTKKRGIDPSIVSLFIGERKIAETAEHSNVAFIGRDENGKARHICLRGIDDTRRFRINVADSDSHYGLSYYGSGNTVYAFEAPIDMLSFITMYPKDWKQNSYVALNGISGNALYKALDEHKNLNSVVLCLDNDKAGQRGCEAIQKELEGMENISVNRLISRLKDWNEDLMELRKQESNITGFDGARKGGANQCHQLQSLF